MRPVAPRGARRSDDWHSSAGSTQPRLFRLLVRVSVCRYHILAASCSGRALASDPSWSPQSPKGQLPYRLVLTIDPLHKEASSDPGCRAQGVSHWA
jgi:hypothetical protein